MPLPEPRSKWLPADWAGAHQRYELNEAIWLNNTETLSDVFRGGNPNTEDGRRIAGLMKSGVMGIDFRRRWNWGRWVSLAERRTDLPIPIGASVVDLSAAQLMSEAPRFRFVDQDGKTRKGDPQTRLDLICNSDAAHLTLLEGAQVASAIGGVVLRALWDANDPDRESVWFDVVGADAALPEFDAAGRLLAVTLFQEYPGGRDGKILRHFERHSVGMIEHAVYLGSPRSVGTPVPLDRIPELESILKLPGTLRDDLTVIIPTGMRRLTAGYWRNRTSRAWRRAGRLANLGRSDFELIEPALDAYSEAWGAMMRDVRIGKARAWVPTGTLERLGTAPGQGAVHDPDREYYLEVNGVDPEAGATGIKTDQPTIRWQEHMQVLAGLKAEILDAVGWSLASYGAPAGAEKGGSITATEVVDRTTKSERTRDAKALQFKGDTASFFRMLSELDATIYRLGQVQDVAELAIEFPDVSQVDPEKQARQFLDLSTAHAISIRQMIRERRPNWDEDEVDAELTLILDDMARATSVTDPARLELSDPDGDPADDVAPPAEREPEPAIAE